MATYTQIKEITFWLSFYLTHQAHQSADFFLYLDQIKKMIGILLMSMFMVLHSGKSPFIFMVILHLWLNTVLSICIWKYNIWKCTLTPSNFVVQRSNALK